jgi:hypothetical protein
VHGTEEDDPGRLSSPDPRAFLCSSLCSAGPGQEPTLWRIRHGRKGPAASGARRASVCRAPTDAWAATCPVAAASCGGRGRGAIVVDVSGPATRRDPRGRPVTAAERRGRRGGRASVLGYVTAPSLPRSSTSAGGRCPAPTSAGVRSSRSRHRADTGAGAPAHGRVNPHPDGRPRRRSTGPDAFGVLRWSLMRSGGVRCRMRRPRGGPRARGLLGPREPLPATPWPHCLGRLATAQRYVHTRGAMSSGWRTYTPGASDDDRSHSGGATVQHG